ncbi:MAG TPA: hypothetical protein VNX68_17600, partial [Nitrosopumilaceae archaeon]|nr:hypothetical protein [Nitrosopumilaceae archaeon]
MKKLVYVPVLWILALMVCNIKCFAGDDKKKKAETDTLQCLELTGKLDPVSMKKGGIYSVKIILDNKVIDTVTTESNRTFKIMLDKNKNYIIKLEKDGYIPKLVSISTQLPDKVEAPQLYRFFFESYLLKQELYSSLDADDVDFPVALIAYNEKCHCFQYDKKYTADVEARISKK